MQNRRLLKLKSHGFEVEFYIGLKICSKVEGKRVVLNGLASDWADVLSRVL